MYVPLHILEISTSDTVAGICIKDLGWRFTATIIMGSNQPLPQEDSPFPLTDVDRWVLSQTDEEFHLHTWTELKDIIGKFTFLFLFFLFFFLFFYSTISLLSQLEFLLHEADPCFLAFSTSSIAAE